MGEDLLEIRDLTKSYAGVRALCSVTMQLRAGEVHALCGENGAGKSTLIKCLSGVVSSDRGQILMQGRVLRSGSVLAAERGGIAALHQESTVFPDLDTVDNIFVGRPRRWGRSGLLDRGRMHREAVELMAGLQQDFSVRVPANRLSAAHRQMIALARALSRECRLLILDEPTASLSHKESQLLMRIVRQLREEGMAILYVSHRLEEVLELADRVTVLRDGQLVATTVRDQLDRSQLIHQMVGRNVDTMERAESRGSSGDRGETPALEVRQLGRRGYFSDISFSVWPGEIVGLGGLIGAGRSEVARSLFGVDSYDSGQVLLNGNRLAPGNAALAIRNGLALVPEDRQHQGLVLPLSIEINLTLAVLKRLTRFGLIDRERERMLAEEYAGKFDIQSPSLSLPVETLSGGNQQRVVLAKWLATGPQVLVLDEPTRGVDVAAKAAVHQRIRELAGQKMATLVISSEIPELVGLCDRILVMCGGQLRGELAGATATPHHILELALPDAPGESAGELRARSDDSSRRDAEP